MHISPWVAVTVAIASVVSASDADAPILKSAVNITSLAIPNATTSSIPSITNPSVQLDRSPSTDESERPWSTGKYVTTDYILAAIFPYSTVTLEAVIAPLRVITRTFLKRHKSTDRVPEDQQMQITIIPTYADLTSEGWRARIHGHVSASGVKSSAKESKDRDTMIERLLVRTTMNRTQHRGWRKHFYVLNDEEKKAARHRADIFMRAPLRNVSLQVWLDGSDCADPTSLKGSTDREGGFDEDILLADSCAGAFVDKWSDTVSNQTIPKLPLRVIESSQESATVSERSAADGDRNAVLRQAAADSTQLEAPTVHLVPAKGLTVISNIDDVLRVAEV